MSRRFWPPQAIGQAAMARSRMVFEGSGTIECFRHLVDPAEAVAARTGALGRVGREGFRIEMRLSRRIVAGARIEHAQQIGEGCDAPDRRSGSWRSALLLKRHRRRQPLDLVDLGHLHLVEETPSVRRDRFQIAALGLGIEGGERQRRLARSRHAGEHDERVARYVDIDILEIVLPSAAHADEAGDLGIAHANLLGPLIRPGARFGCLVGGSGSALRIKRPSQIRHSCARANSEGRDARQEGVLDPIVTETLRECSLKIAAHPSPVPTPEKPGTRPPHAPRDPKQALRPPSGSGAALQDVEAFHRGRLVNN